MVRELVANFLKDPAEAKAFMEDVDKFLASRGIKITEEDKIALKSIIESWEPTVLLSKDGGHTNFNTHTDYNASDGHCNRTSHTNHSSSY